MIALPSLPTHAEELAVAGEAASQLFSYISIALYGWLAGILISYCALTTLMKHFYLQRDGWQ